MSAKSTDRVYLIVHCHMKRDLEPPLLLTIYIVTKQSPIILSKFKRKFKTKQNTCQPVLGAAYIGLKSSIVGV